jgi:acetyl/propionyl-CoA carboxylase alpha subunit
MSNPEKAYQIQAGNFLFTLSAVDILAADIIQKSPQQYHLIKDHQSVHCNFLEVDATGKKMKIEVEGETFDVQLKDELDLMLDQMGFSTSVTRHVKEIKAPMPGLVLSVSVTEGQELSAGDRLLILEAMKMENSIMIHTKARIKSVKVTAGQAVDKGQVLVVLE